MFHLKGRSLPLYFINLFAQIPFFPPFHFANLLRKRARILIYSREVSGALKKPPTTSINVMSFVTNLVLTYRSENPELH